MAKSDELVKYITQRVVTYIERPKEVRRQIRLEKKERKKTMEPWQTRWFGMVPMAFSIWFRQLREKEHKKKVPPHEK